MKLSTRAQYGVRLMLGLAIRHGKGYTRLNDIARSEGISEKYLSLIVIPLRGLGLVNSTRGVHGGYALARDPSQITVKEIVDALEGDNAIVDCVRNASACSRVPICVSRDIWTILEDKIAETLRGITLDQLIRMGEEKVDRALSHDI
ncbi:MAG: Rrf2 family transcriptional regulator [Smithellaceae bacterium]|nr:Rrf2 family transcriptional regulator [Smithellaceae bacterium]